jgi:prepilin-type N-terminal cleavage/methylation domain-containing protein
MSRSQSGFSLVEMLVYIALLVVITAAAVSTLLQFSEAFMVYRTEKALSRQLGAVVERIQYDIRNSVAVNAVGSTLDVSPGTLALDRIGSSVTYTLSAGTVTVVHDAAPAVPITGGVVTVDALSFSQFNSGTTELVQFEVTATAAIGDYSKTETYQTSALLRGSYE